MNLRRKLIRRVYSPLPLTARPPLQLIIKCHNWLFEPISKIAIVSKFSVTCKLEKDKKRCGDAGTRRHGDLFTRVIYYLLFSELLRQRLKVFRPRVPVFARLRVIFNLGAWVKFLISHSQMRVGYMRVNLRGGNIGVSEQLLDRAHISAVLN